MNAVTTANVRLDFANAELMMAPYKEIVHQLLWAFLVLRTPIAPL
jgi:hypothetical protein